MRTVPLVLLVWLSSIAHAGEIEELRVADLDEQITLRADGTAAYAFRGHLNSFVNDERVGQFEARLDPREFPRLAALPGATGFAEAKDFYLPYSTWIVRTTVVRDGRSKTVERNDRGLATDPEPPADLWALEMAARGLAAQLKWHPVPQGVKLALGGPVRGLRMVIIRGAGTGTPFACVYTERDFVQIPMPPGNYLADVSEVRDGRGHNLWTSMLAVSAGQYTTAKVEPPTNQANTRSSLLVDLIIETPNHWWLKCRADGSGGLGYGAMSSDATGFKAGTIDFVASAKELEHVATKEPPQGSRFRVIFRSKGGPPISVYTNDAKLIQRLFSEGAKKNNSEGRGAHFDQRWTDNPPGLEK